MNTLTKLRDGLLPTPTLTLPKTLDTDEFHHLMRNPRRRMILRIAAADGPVGLREISARTAREEFGHDYDAADRKTVYVTMYQCHVPELERHGLIDHGRGRSAPVELTAAGRRVVAVLEDMDERYFGGACA